jgi:hypothetical protein
LLVIGQSAIDLGFVPIAFTGQYLVCLPKETGQEPAEPAKMYLKYLASLSSSHLDELKKEWLSGWDGKWKYENPLISKFFEKRLLKNVKSKNVKDSTFSREEEARYSQMLSKFHRVRKSDPERLMSMHMDNPKLVKALQEYRERERQ